MGWIHYDETVTPPNTIDDLTNSQLQVIGTQYTADLNAYEAYINCLNDAEFAEVQNIKFHVDWVYETLNRLQTYSADLMNERVIISSSPLTYNTMPVDATDLVSQIEAYIDDVYINELTTAKITYGVNRMVLYSKMDGTGDWTYYSTAVTS